MNSSHLSFLCFAVISGTLISLSESLLLWYRNATRFCILVLYTEILPNLLTSSSRFLVAFWETSSGLEPFFFEVELVYNVVTVSGVQQ